MPSKDPEFTDYQVLTLIKAHPGSSMSDILRYARKEMPSFGWTWGKIQKAILRLSDREKVILEDGTKEIPIKIVNIRID
jgi:hypothetical protein